MTSSKRGLAVGSSGSRLCLFRRAGWGQDKGLKVSIGCDTLKIIIQITGLSKNLDWDNRMREPY